MGKLLVTKNITFFAIFSCSWCKSRKREIKKKALNILMREKKTFYTNTYTKISIDKAGSRTSFT